MKLKLKIIGIILLILGGLSYIGGLFVPSMYDQYLKLTSYILLLGGVTVFIINCIRKLFCYNKKCK